MSNDLLIALIREYEDGYMDLMEVEAAMSDWTKGYIDDLKDRLLVSKQPEFPSGVGHALTYFIGPVNTFTDSWSEDYG